MKRIQFDFDKFSLVIYPKWNLVVYMDLFGNVERYTIEQFGDILERVIKARKQAA